MEALRWIAGNKNRCPFASNFFTRERAVEMITCLYREGAVKVLVDEVYNEAWRIEEEEGPYSATLIVKLPKSKPKVARLMKAIKSFSPDELDKGGQGAWVRVWWD